MADRNSAKTGKNPVSRFMTSRVTPLLLGMVAGFASPLAATPITSLEYVGFGNGRGPLEDPDAEAGLKSILDGEDFNYGLPLKLFKKIATDQGYTPEKLWQVLGSVPSPPWRQVGELPIPISDSVFVRDGAQVLNVNCFSCHSGVVAGRVVAGLGSSHIDGASFVANGQKLVAAYDGPVERLKIAFLLNRAEMNILRGFIDHQRNVILPVLHAKARGEIHGPWVVWMHIARMIDPAAGMETVPARHHTELERLLDRPLPPVDPSPWWNLRYKQRAFWTRDVDLASLPTFALNLMDPHPSNTATFPERMERTRKQLAFAKQTVAPPFPQRDRVDLALAARGRALFHGEADLADGGRLPCFSCHGNYSEQGDLTHYPERGQIDLAVIGTDPAYATILNGSFKPLYDHFAKSRFIPPGSDSARYPDVAGYEPPPLKGIWASAPYFHNGSVPNVEAVLKSSIRPQFWRRSLDPSAYDYAHLGLSTEAVSAAEFAELELAAERSEDALSQASLDLRRVYATTRYGRSNSGHTFGDRMSDEERRAVLEFLKLL